MQALISVPFHSTPLHVSIQKRTDSIFDLLLEKGAALEVQSAEGFPPLWYALMQESPDFQMATRLIQKGASPNTVSLLPNIFVQKVAMTSLTFRL